MGLERNNIPEEYRCEECEPRYVDKARARKLQLSKRLQFSESNDPNIRANNPLPKPPKAPVKKQPRSQSRGTGGGNRRVEKGAPKTPKGARANQNEGKKGLKVNKPKPVKRRTSTKKINAKQPAVPKEEKKEKEASAPALPVAAAPIAADRTPSPAPAATAGLNQLRQWIDSYEEAVTNHYSPELRSRIAAIKVNGVHSDLKLPSNISNLTPKCRVSTNPAGVKILVTTATVAQGTPIIEVRGKYMLSKNPSGPSLVPDRSGPPKWSPFVFHHKLGSHSEQATEVCVDATTYGNDARFVRRSCRPNSELRHCIEKGALHVYIVSMATLDAKSEILLPVKQGMYCACGQGDKCLAHSSRDIIPTHTKRARNRRRTVSDSSTPKPVPVPPVAPPTPESTPPRLMPAVPSPPTTLPLVNTAPTNAHNNNNNILVSKNTPSPTKEKAPVASPPAPLTPPVAPAKRPQPPPPPQDVAPPPEVELSPPPPKVPKTAAVAKEKDPPAPPPPPPPAPPMAKEQPVAKVRGQAVSARRATTPATKQEEKKRTPLPPKDKETPTKKQPPTETPSSASKMTREERKMEAIMKAFERMEKDEQRKQQGGTTSTTAVPGSGRQRKSSVSSTTTTPAKAVSPVRVKSEKPSMKKKSPKALRETRSKTLRSRRPHRTEKNQRKPSGVKRNNRPNRMAGAGAKTPVSSSSDEEEDEGQSSSPEKSETRNKTRTRTARKLRKGARTGSDGRGSSGGSGGRVDDDDSAPATSPSASPASSPLRPQHGGASDRTPPKVRIPQNQLQQQS
ncbi:unnamed protein product [Nesidiocoris tenuis]|uniref:SET domain-containing protein n=1 Tax=Nesidiocoris tenuis TaxID=355587 RepID=A0A6H5G6S6_9HEMI|nr:unnamed protein product [Nesidiocoris tenuis]